MHKSSGRAARRVLVLVAALCTGAGVFTASAAGSGTVTGFVTDEARAPVAGLEVTLWDSARGGSTQESAVTDAAGAFTVELPPGAYAYAVEQSGPLPGGAFVRTGGYCHEGPCPEVTDGGVTWWNVTVERGAALTGTVVGPDGAPVHSELRTLDEERAVTDFDGRYWLVVPFDVQSVVVQPVELDAKIHTHVFDCGEGACPALEAGGVTHWNVTYEPSFFIRGVVTNPDGAPVRAASVNAGSLGHDSTDSAGAFTVPVPAGEHRLTVHPPFRQDDAARLARTFLPCDERDGSGCVRVESDTVWVNLTLPWAASLTGVVVDPDGRPVEGVNVHAQNVADGSGYADCRFCPDDSTFTGPDGTFALHVAPGLYRVGAWPPEGVGLEGPRVACAPATALTEDCVTVGRDGAAIELRLVSSEAASGGPDSSAEPEDIGGDAEGVGVEGGRSTGGDAQNGVPFAAPAPLLLVLALVARACGATRRA